MRQNRVHVEVRAAQIDLNFTPPVLRVDVGNQPQSAEDASIVNEEVNGPYLLLNSSNQAIDSSAIRDIGGNCRSGAAELFDGLYNI